jgi:hypothetical protein
MQILQYFPGTKVTIFLDSFNADGYRADGYAVPQVLRILKPNLTALDGYTAPLPMTKVDTGLYVFQFVLPTGGAAVGSYLMDVIYWDPVTVLQKQTLYQILVAAPFGNYSAVLTI